MSILTENNKIYYQLLQNYQKNREKKITTWTDFDSIFVRQGKQGIVGSLILAGLLPPQKRSISRENGIEEPKYVFKLSQYINHIAIHEALIMKGLNSLANYCPHFCRSYGVINCQVDPKIRKEGNPFEISDVCPINKEVLLLEYIPGYKFLTYIKSQKILDEVIYSVIKQVLLAVIIAQRDKKFSHYDLHANNIILRSCPVDTVLVYVIDEENQFCVPTYGYIAVIIDFGFSYIDEMKDEPFWNTLAHTDVGFMIDHFDWVADPKLFLVSATEDLRRYRRNKLSKKFEQIVENIFSALDIDWEAGWDNYEGNSVADQVNIMLEDFNPGSKTFKQFDHFGIDLIQSLIILPMEPQKYKNINKYYRAFLKEFMKIENELNSDFYNLYILKKVVDVAREIRPIYLDPKQSSSAVKKFRESILGEIYRIAKFCHPKEVNYETMLCSLLLLGRSTEGIMYDLMYIRKSEKEEEYKKLPVKSTLDIFAAIEFSIPSKYEFSHRTEVIIFDSLKKSTSILKLESQNILEVNQLEPSSRGTYLYELKK